MDSFSKELVLTITSKSTGLKELSLWNKIKYLNLNIFRIRCCKPLMFQTHIIWSNRIHSLKYLRTASFGSRDIVIRKSEFVAKTQFLYKYVCRFRFKNVHNLLKNILKLASSVENILQLAASHCWTVFKQVWHLSEISRNLLKNTFTNAFLYQVHLFALFSGTPPHPTRLFWGQKTSACFVGKNGLENPW